MEHQWATIVVMKHKGGRSFILNESKRGLFITGAVYYNHRLKAYEPGTFLNVVIRTSATGRRMVQEIVVKNV
jgi:hypothetical protein